MKKIKEISILLALFIIFFVLSFLIYLPSPFVAGSESAFFSNAFYLKLLFTDKTVFFAIINTFRRPLVSSVVLIALSMLILKKKIKFTRKSYYLTVFAASFIISIYFFFTKAVLYNIFRYIFFPISISLLCVIIFWILELIADIVKRIKTRNMQ